MEVAVIMFRCLIFIYDPPLIRQLWSDFENYFYLKGHTIILVISLSPNHDIVSGSHGCEENTQVLVT